MTLSALPQFAPSDVSHARDDQQVPDQEARPSLGERLARRRWAVIATTAVTLVGMVYMFAWDPIVYHMSIWVTPGDVWGVFRGAHYVGWGYIGGVYGPGTGVNTLPGLEIVLAPVAMVSGHFGLTESVNPIFLSHPTAALILQPAELILASTVVFATDALGERLDVGRGRQIVLCFVIAAIVFPVAAVWGHAEDAVAMTFCLYALIALLDGKWSKCGWLLGLGILMQPLVALLLPLVLGSSPSGQRMLVAVRSSVLSVVLVALALVGNASGTYRGLVQQPTYPSVDHPTPWLALAPRISAGNTVSGKASFVSHHGQVALIGPTAQHLVIVAAGPGRTLYLIVAVLAGLFVWRRPQAPLRLLWLAATILAARCFFEAVMCPYYLAPPLVLALVLVARTNRPRFGGAVAIAIATSVYAYLHFSPWVWWVPVVVGLSAVLAIGYPETETLRPSSRNGTDPVRFGRGYDAETGPQVSLEPAP